MLYLSVEILIIYAQDSVNKYGWIFTKSGTYVKQNPLIFDISGFCLELVDGLEPPTC